MLGRLQKGLGRHAITCKPGFFCKLERMLDELPGRASNIALCARALKDTVAGLALMLRREPFATSLMSRRFDKRYDKLQRECVCCVLPGYAEPATSARRLSRGALNCDHRLVLAVAEDPHRCAQIADRLDLVCGLDGVPVAVVDGNVSIADYA
jgi:hypothetical protein